MENQGQRITPALDLYLLDLTVGRCAGVNHLFEDRDDILVRLIEKGRLSSALA